MELQHRTPPFSIFFSDVANKKKKFKLSKFDYGSVSYLA